MVNKYKKEAELAHEMWKQGDDIKVIAKKYKLSSKRMTDKIYEWKSELGWFKKKRRIDSCITNVKLWRDYIKNEVSKGKKIKDLAKEFKTPYDTFKMAVRRVIGKVNKKIDKDTDLLIKYLDENKNMTASQGAKDLGIDPANSAYHLRIKGRADLIGRVDLDSPLGYVYEDIRSGDLYLYIANNIVLHVDDEGGISPKRVLNAKIFARSLKIKDISFGELCEIWGYSEKELDEAIDGYLNDYYMSFVSSENKRVAKHGVKKKKGSLDALSYRGQSRYSLGKRNPINDIDNLRRKYKRERTVDNKINYIISILRSGVINFDDINIAASLGDKASLIINTKELKSFYEAEEGVHKIYSILESIGKERALIFFLKEYSHGVNEEVMRTAIAWKLAKEERTEIEKYARNLDYSYKFLDKKSKHLLMSIHEIEWVIGLAHNISEEPNSCNFYYALSNYLLDL